MPRKSQTVITPGLRRRRIEAVVAVAVAFVAVVYIWHDLSKIDTSRVPRIVDETLVEDSATGQPAVLVSYSNGTKDFKSQVSSEEWKAMAKGKDSVLGRLVVIAIALAMICGVFISDWCKRRREEGK